MRAVAFLLCLVIGAGALAEDPLLYGRGAAFAQPGSPWDQQWQDFKANMAQNPSIDMDYFTRGERGSESQIMHDLRRERVTVGGMSLQGLATSLPELTVAMAPYLFDSAQEVDFVYDNYLLDFYNKLAAEKGLMLLQWVEVGWTNMYANSNIRRPEDVAGLKLRGSPNEAAQMFLEELGADTIPLGTADLVPALQTGLVSGGLSSVVFHFFLTRKYASHVILTRHSYDTGAIVVNRNWFDRATPAQQDTILSSWPPSNEARARVRALTDFATNTMREEGINVSELTPDEQAAWRAATKPVINKLIRRVGGQAQAAFDVIQQGKASWARQQSQDSETKQYGDVP